MKKKNSLALITFIVLFLGMFLITCGLAVYRGVVQNERGIFTVSLSSAAKETPVTVDIAQQGLPKRLLQPGMITVFSGHRGGITNETGGELNVSVKAVDFPFEVEMESVDQDFNVHTGVLHRTLKPREAFSMGIDLDIPRAMLSAPEIASGIILFTNSDTDAIIAKVPVKVINSQAGQ